MMIIDSSAMVEVLVGSDVDDELLDRVAANSLHAPHLLDTEVLNALRGLELSGKLPSARADEARHDYRALRITRYAVDGVADRVWELRHNYNCYDASYIVLAEALDIPLVTCDGKLAAGNHGAEIRVYPRS
jgi:predicted nucleic acid-binding protein